MGPRAGATSVPACRDSERVSATARRPPIWTPMARGGDANTLHRAPLTESARAVPTRNPGVALSVDRVHGHCSGGDSMPKQDSPPPLAPRPTELAALVSHNQDEAHVVPLEDDD